MSADPTRAHRPRLAGCILTKDEEGRVEQAIRSLQRVADAVVVVDSESTDRTREVAAACGAEVWVRPFDGFSRQRNWALEEIGRRLDPDWILSIDADEWLGDKLITELRERLQQGGLTADAYLIRRRTRFAGRVLRRGGFARTWLLRLFRPGTVEYEERAVNEHIRLRQGAQLGRMRGSLEHTDVESWERYIDKHNRYSTLEAQARHNLREARTGRTSLREAWQRRDLRRRWLREVVWNRLPARPAIRFVQIYVLRGGLFDGQAGFRRALFEAWQEMCIDLKVETMG